LFAGLGAYIFWNKGVSIVGPNKAGIFLHLMPVFSSFMAIFILNEKLMNFHVVGAILIIAGIYGFNVIQFNSTHEVTDNAQIETNVIPMIPRVAGYISQVAIQDYQNVKEGDLIAQIDTQEYQLALNEMEADLDQSKADLANAKASLKNAEVSLTIANTNIELNKIRKLKANQDLTRDDNLLKEGAITKKQYDDSKLNFETNEKQLSNADNDLVNASSKLDVFRSNIAKSEAVIKIKEARINQQKLKISFCKIFASANGKVGKLSVIKGQYIQPGQTIGNIVRDEKFWIIANFKESQIENIKPGLAAQIKIDAYPDAKITGKVLSLSDATGAKFSLLPPDNATGNFVKVTQRVPVRIEIDDMDKVKSMLKAGLSIEVTIKTK
jgi:membrane fusion protein (multidrug efflux system)